MSKQWKVNNISDDVLEFINVNDNKKLYINKILGERYVIKDILSASGGFGIIFKAIDSRLNRKVLIKARRYDNEAGLFSYQGDSTRAKKIKDIRSQIEFECDCLLAFRGKGECRMPNLNNLIKDKSLFIKGPHTDVDGNVYYEEDEELINSEPYIVMQMIEGENLADYVSKGIDAVLKERNYDKYIYWENDVMGFGLELCTMLEDFHKLGANKSYFIYQDLKPENIILTHDKHITLIDFGAMTYVRDDNFGNSCSMWEKSGSPGLGTWGYKAPEMDPLNGQLSRLDYKVDIYALGATLFHLLTGIDLSKMEDEYCRIPIEELKKMGCTESTYNLIKTAVEQDKDKRFESTKKMRQAFYNLFTEMKRG